MIKYTLKCSEGHAFDSWFQSAAAFDKLHGAGMVACAVCGSDKVDKSLMAPRVSTRDADDSAQGTALTAPASEMEAKLAAFRKHIETNSTYVGGNFATEARAIHDGDAPERLIHGEANRDEARKLLEDGIAIAPLPFLPTRKAN